MDIGTYVYIFGGWLVGGIVGASTGMGAVMSAMPLLTMVIPPAEAVFVCCLVGVLDCTQLVYLYRKWCVWSDVRDLIIGMVPGVIVGVLALKIFSVQAFQLMISAMLACFIALQLFRMIRKSSAYQLPNSMIIGVIAGLLCGFVNASVALMGAPLGIYVLLKGWEPNTARGNMSAIFAVTTIFTVVAQAMSGLYTLRIVELSIIGMAGAFCGNLIGVRIGRRVSKSLLTKIILCFLTIFAVSLFMKGIQ